jgi:hypothetical protein
MRRRVLLLAPAFEPQLHPINADLDMIDRSGHAS